MSSTQRIAATEAPIECLDRVRVDRFRIDAMRVRVWVSIDRVAVGLGLIGLELGLGLR